MTSVRLNTDDLHARHHRECPGALPDERCRCELGALREQLALLLQENGKLRDVPKLANDSLVRQLREENEDLRTKLEAQLAPMPCTGGMIARSCCGSWTCDEDGCCSACGEAMLVECEGCPRCQPAEESRQPEGSKA